MEILDIDFFKQYNDNYGHQQGDECIIAIANELKKMEDGPVSYTHLDVYKRQIF